MVPLTGTNVDIVSHYAGPGSIDNGLVGLLGSPVLQLAASSTGGAPVQVDLPYQPDATAVMASLVPQANLYPFAGLAAQPLAGPFTAFALR